MATRASRDYEEPAKNVGDQPGPTVLSKNKARAGETRGHMRAVLIISTALAIVALAVVYFSFLAAV
jgi:hypothetical protein